MKAIGHYVVFTIEKEKERVSKSGIVTLSDSASVTTNSGDKVGTNNIYKVHSVGSQVELPLQVGDTCIVNPWEMQIFESKETTYGVCPDLAIKVVL